SPNPRARSSRLPPLLRHGLDRHPPPLWARLQPRALALAHPPATAGRGCPRFALIRKTPLNPPLPSQGREQELAAEAAPTRQGSADQRVRVHCASSTAVAAATLRLSTAPVPGIDRRRSQA